MKIIGIVGPIGAGKDVVSSYLETQHGYKTVNMGDIIREIASKERRKPTRENLHKIQKEYTDKYGQDYFAKETVKRVLNMWSISGHLPNEDMKMEIKAIINGIRRIEDARVPKEKFGDTMTLLYVDANQKTRFERLRSRGQPRDPSTFEDFMSQEKAEKKLFSIEDLKNFADTKVENNGSVQELQSAVESILSGKEPASP